MNVKKQSKLLKLKRNLLKYEKANNKVRKDLEEICKHGSAGYTDEELKEIEESCNSVDEKIRFLKKKILF